MAERAHPGEPAAGGGRYILLPGASAYRAQVLNVLRIEDGKIVEVTIFEPHLLTAFGLPPELPPDGDPF